MFILVSCDKNETVLDQEPTTTTPALSKNYIADSEGVAEDYRDLKRDSVPLLDTIWTRMGFNFSESGLSPLDTLFTYESTAGDTIIIEATDEAKNEYKLQMVTLTYPYSKGYYNGAKRWPTGNEWACLGITLAGSLLSGGVGIYCTVVNLVAMCAVEDKAPVEDRRVILSGWYNDKREFQFHEDVYDSIDGTHMNACLFIGEWGTTPIYETEGIITGDSTNSLTFNYPNLSPTLVWSNIIDPGNMTNVPAEIDTIYNHFQTVPEVPFDLYSTRDALMGELISFVVQ